MGYAWAAVLLALCASAYALILQIRFNKLQKEIRKNELNEGDFQQAFDALQEAVFIHEIDGGILYVNKAMEILYGIDRAQAIGKKVMDFSAPGINYERKIPEIEADIKAAGFSLFEWKAQKYSDKSVFDTEVALKQGTWRGRPAFFVVVRDITRYKQSEDIINSQLEELRATEEELRSNYEELTATEEELRVNYSALEQAQDELKKSNERYRLIAEGANDAIWDWNLEEDSLLVSPRLYELLGYDEGELLISNKSEWLKNVYMEDIADVLQDFARLARNKEEKFYQEYRFYTKDGSNKWFRSSGKIIYSNEGKPTRFAGSLADISSNKEQEEKIRSLAYDDFLTGLPNREYLKETLSERLVSCNESECAGTIFYIDLDDFKIINDNFGHQFGDRLLCIIADRLKGHFAGWEDVFIARLGGDEFVVNLDAVHSIGEVEKIAAELINLSQRSLQVDGHHFHLPFSIGIAIYPRDGTSVDDLLKKADTAMYKAKVRGRKCYMFYHESMGEAIARKVDMGENLRHAVETEELRLFYQPQIDTETGEIVGFEALLRWFSPVYGLVPPLDFIPLAEENGMIIEIGKWVFETACAFIARLAGVVERDLCISINVSPIQFMQDDFPDTLLEVIKKYNLDPPSLGIEITENTLIESFDVVVEKIQYLRELGFHIYLDDFGTGYSSLNYLKNLPIDTVKIDKSFIDDISVNKTDRRLLSSIVDMAKGLGLAVVAEGVETADQLRLLIESDCTQIQGYLISRPVPESDAEKAMRDGYVWDGKNGIIS